MSLKSFNLHESNFSKNISKSLEGWLDYNFFADGGYNYHSGVLVTVGHPRYSQNRVFGSSNKNWVWESGTVNVSINNVLQTSGYSINYRDGLVIFDSQVNGTVTCEYNHKYLNVFSSKDHPFFRGENQDFEVYSGVFRENAIQLPCIVVNIGSKSSDPIGLGSYSRNVNQELLLSVFHKRDDIVEKVLDVLYDQIDSHFPLYDFEQAYLSGACPLDFNGLLLNASGTPEYLLNNYAYSDAKNSTSYIKETEKESVQKIDNNLYHGTVRFRTETELRML